MLRVGSVGRTAEGRSVEGVVFIRHHAHRCGQVGANGNEGPRVIDGGDWAQRVSARFLRGDAGRVPGYLTLRAGSAAMAAVVVSCAPAPLLNINKVIRISRVAAI